jgi:hypothetical protein
MYSMERTCGITTPSTLRGRCLQQSAKGSGAGLIHWESHIKRAQRPAQTLSRRFKKDRRRERARARKGT